MPRWPTRSRPLVGCTAHRGCTPICARPAGRCRRRRSRTRCAARSWWPAGSGAATATRQDKTAPKFPDLLKRDFTADRPNAKWVGDMTEIPTGADGRGPKLYLATVIGLYSRRLLGAATGLHPNAELACEAIKMALAARGSAEQIAGVPFHTDRGSTTTADAITALCRRLEIRQSMGRVGPAL